MARRISDEGRRRPDPLDPFEECETSLLEVPGQVFGDRSGTWLDGSMRGRDELLRFGCESDTRRRTLEEQRFGCESIPYGDDPLFQIVPDNEREVAVDDVEAFDPGSSVRLENES